VKYTTAELPSKGTGNPRHVTELKGQQVVLPLNRMPSDRNPDSADGESFDWGALDCDDSDSPEADNTVITLWGDHGWHLGEKQHWGKWTGWERSTRVPLLVAPPRSLMGAGFAAGAKCAEPVSLLDLYPTLIEICGLPNIEELSDRSLVPLLKSPSHTTGRVVLTTFDKGNYSLAGARWHYILYADGSEELYDRATDPHEWTNLAARSEHAAQKATFAKHVPDDHVYPAPAAGVSGALKNKKANAN
jgi:arylsulfatase A-like enzyme